MNDVWFHITFGHFLVLSALVFTIGVLGVILRKNALIVLMSIELMLNAGNIAILTFARMHSGPAGMEGHTLAFVVIAVAAAEAAVGLAIVVAVFRSRAHADLDRLTSLKH